MKYGIYKVTLSIGFSGASREDEIDITEEYEEDEWNEMTEDEQDKVLREWMEDLLGQHIEMSYEEPI
jgi:hypothetical protein